jgi:hypothetical protein
LTAIGGIGGDGSSRNHIILGSRKQTFMIVFLVFVIISGSLVPFICDSYATPDKEQKSSILALSGVVFRTSANASTQAYIGEDVTFWAYATSDIPAATLTFTIYYDYYDSPYPTLNTESPFSVNVTTSPGVVIAKFAYDHLGNFSSASGNYSWAFLSVTDGVSTVTRQIVVYVKENQDPQFLQSLPPTIVATKGVPYDLATQVNDPDNDSLSLTWDFGDGSPTAENTTGPALAGFWANQTHTWNPILPPGTPDSDTVIENFAILTLTLEDSAGNIVTTTYPVNVQVSMNYPPDASISAPSSVSVGSDVLFTAYARDLEGDPLTWTFDFGDGAKQVYETAGVVNQTVWNNVTHVFLAAGSYLVNLYISDRIGEENQTFPHNKSASTAVTATVNVPPGVMDRVEVQPGENLVINVTIGYVLATFYIEAGDNDGDVLTAVWDLGDGSDPVVNVSAGGTKTYRFTVEHQYSVPGQYNVTVNISDGNGHELDRYRVINVTSNNVGPDFTGIRTIYPEGRGDYAEPNETISIRLTVSDQEFDSISFTIDWGDQSEWLNVTVSEYVDGNVTLEVSHSYLAPAQYIIRIVMTDGQLGVGEHVLYWNLTVKVEYERIIVHEGWGWWDYTSLGLFAMIPVLVAIWFGINRRRQRALDDAGITYDQWLTRKAEIIEELKGKNP